MKEKPIIFSAEMVRAILDGRKVQTRRPVKPQPQGHRWECLKSYTHKNQLLETTRGLCCRFSHHIDENPLDDGVEWMLSPFGKPGDRLWVRETWAAVHFSTDERGYVDDVDAALKIPRDDDEGYWSAVHKAGDSWFCEEDDPDERGFVWRPSIHMPRWASRITLEVKRVWVERVQDITCDGIGSEGIRRATPHEFMHCRQYFTQFMTLWNSIYAAKGFGWEQNPWVWACEFEVIK